MKTGKNDGNNACKDSRRREPKVNKKSLKPKNKKEISKVPNVVSIKSNRSSHQIIRLVCPICLNVINKNMHISTRCGHVFCRDCIRKAYRLKPSCPICRRSIRGKAGFHDLYLEHNNEDPPCHGLET